MDTLREKLNHVWPPVGRSRQNVGEDKIAWNDERFISFCIQRNQDT